MPDIIIIEKDLLYIIVDPMPDSCTFSKGHGILATHENIFSF